MITFPSGTTAPFPKSRENGDLLLTISLEGDQPGFEFLGFVRHEAAYTAVMTQEGGHNLVCCHQYPTQTRGWSNLAV
jgi:hypothetical protein